MRVRAPVRNWDGHSVEEGKVLGHENLGVIVDVGKLRGMRERVKQMGGALQIQPNFDGTSVLVVLPVRATDNEAGSQLIGSQTRFLPPSVTEPRAGR